MPFFKKQPLNIGVACLPDVTQTIIKDNGSVVRENVSCSRVLSDATNFDLEKMVKAKVPLESVDTRILGAFEASQINTTTEEVNNDEE